MKKMKTSICILIVLFLSQCSSKNCYEIKLQFGNDSNLTKDSPVLIGNGIVGFVEDLHRSADGSEISICVPNSVRIPKDSKLVEGYIGRIGNGVQITLGSQVEFLNSGDRMIGVHKDTIITEATKVDSAMFKKIIEITNDIVEKEKKKKK